MKCPVVSFEMSTGLVWLWAANVEAQGYVPGLLENLRGMSCSGLVGSWVVFGFNVGMEAFDELLSINVPWSQEFSGVPRFWT